MAAKLLHKLPLLGVALLAAVVLVRLGLMTWWSLGDGGPAFDTRLWLYWILAVAVLVMLFRFAWQLWTGRHRSRF